MNHEHLPTSSVPESPLPSQRDRFEKSDAAKSVRRTPLECPTCFSHRAEILNTDPPKACCIDCDKIYPVHYRHIDLPQEQHQEQEESEPAQKKKRKTKADYRAEITPAQPLSDKELGPNTVFMHEVIEATPEQIAKAEHLALKYSAKFGEEFEASWFLQTEFLTKMKTVNRVRACYALRWRPKFLAGLAIGRTMVFACRSAKVAYNTAKYHRAQDRQFDEQCLTAQDYAGELLESRAFQRALEGDCEPIVYMGVVVGHIRKFDSRLQIELLRAYRPAQFKTPGQAQVTVNTGPSLLVLTEEDRAKLIEARREALALMPGADNDVPAHSVPPQPQ